jgi:uncharacterized protein (TIGR02687 family)
MKRIHDSLRQVIGRHRLVFWYDGAGDWDKEFEAFAADDVEKVRVENNEFGVKVHILHHSDRNTRFLIYFPSPRPNDADNWLLDLLLQGHEYKADRASLALQEAGLSYEFHHVVEQHLAFFNAPKRIEALRGILDKDDDADAIRLKMMAVLAGTAPDVDTLLLHFFREAAQASLFDPLTAALGPAELVGDFWKGVAPLFSYTADEPTLVDFAVSLFRGANPLETSASLNPHGRVFLQRWKDSQSHADAFRHWSARLEADLHVEARLESLTDIAIILDADEFPVFEKKVIHSLCRSFEVGAGKEAILPIIQSRRRSFWYQTHEHGYRALEQAVELRELVAGAELNVGTLDEGLTRYTQGWWRIDMAYRRFWFHQRHYAQTNLMEQIAAWVEKTYVNNFLLPLTDRLSDRIRELTRWLSEALPPQTAFFDRYVQPFLERGQKVFVVISDALRYEAACEFAALLRNEDRWTCEVEAMLGALPSYTQLGMAALLPGKTREIDGATGNVILDSRSTIGTQNRSEIVKAKVNGRGTALQAEQFLELNTKTEGRALMRDHDVVYIYHNAIDAVGDSVSTEAQTVEAVERAFGELMRILKKIANINATNMILTSDHGFLFQQEAVAEGDMATLPQAVEWTYRNRRFAIGTKVQNGPGVKLFQAADLGLTGEWTAAFPLSLGRFPLQGSGKRYVHGGVTPQEVVVPVLRIHKARASDTSRVEVDVLRMPSKITTGQASFALYQEQPVDDKILARQLRIGLFSKDGAPLSEVRTVSFDSGDSEARRRETNIVLALSRNADAFNNQEIELRMEETLPGTSQSVVYRNYTLRLQKPFGSDFDE